MVQEDQATAIDIHYQKLLESLIDRKIIPSKWQDQVRLTRKKIDETLSEMPDVAEITDLLRGKYLHYFQCKRIMDLLEQSHGGKTTNFFGQYTSSILRSWYDVLKTYEKNNVYVGEAARIVFQNAAYDIPALKRTVQQHEKLITDNNRKIADYKKNIAESKQKLESTCQELGIPGNEYRTELQQLVHELPQLYRDLNKSCCDPIVIEAIEYHRAMQEYLHVTSEKTTNPPELQVVARLFAANDKEPESMINLSTSKDESQNQVQEIQWGIETPSVSWEEEETDAAVEIDWAITTESSSDPVSKEIDWEIETQTPVEIQWDEEQSLTDPVPVEESESKLGLLMKIEFRNQLKNDLYELDAFFKQRLLELNADEGVTYANQFQGTATILAHQTIESIGIYAKAITNVLDLMNAERFNQLVMIDSSARYLDRLEDSLKRKARHAVKYEEMIADLKTKTAGLIEQVAKAGPEIEALSSSTKALKSQLEQVLQPLFRGYRVHIVGDINNL